MTTFSYPDNVNGSFLTFTTTLQKYQYEEGKVKKNLRKRNLIAEKNHVFLRFAVGKVLCEDDFEDAVLESLFEPVVQYGIEDRGYSGYISIETGIKTKGESDKLSGAIHNGILKKVALSLPHLIKGELNAEAEINLDGWRFHFRISKYERDSAHGFVVVDDPIALPDNEKLGRFVELKITPKE